MLTVEDYGRIRRAHRDGLSIRAIAKKFQHSRRKVREALRHAEPRKYTRQKAPAAPKLDPAETAAYGSADLSAAEVSAVIPADTTRFAAT
jgi:IS30 family transposase